MFILQSFEVVRNCSSKTDFLFSYFKNVYIITTIIIIILKKMFILSLRLKTNLLKYFSVEQMKIFNLLKNDCHQFVQKCLPNIFRNV